MSVIARLTRRIARSRLPRRTVRLRLTLLYGGLFLASGAALLSVTYLLVAHAVDRPMALISASFSEVRIGTSPQAAPTGRAGSADPTGSAGPTGSADPTVSVGPTPTPSPGAFGPQQPLADELSAAAEKAMARQKSAMMHELTIQSGIALGGMSVTSILLGWLVAGRILRPLRTITATARDISATSLHHRLALAGPEDELKELGDTFDGLLGRLETSFQAQRQFVAHASHELRTPLARQRVLGQVALADPDATEQSLRAAHERILAAGAQQERLIEALLTLARGQAGIEVRRPFDLARLTREVLAARADEADQRHVTIRPSISDAAALGHPALAERLVVNLVDNALRHNVPGGRVEIATGSRRGHAVLTVANTGPAVAPAELERLFRPFQRLGTPRTAGGTVSAADRTGPGAGTGSTAGTGPETGTSRAGRAPRTEGLGLGLSIVAAVAHAHDATVDTVPRPGGGLVITITFPAANAVANGTANAVAVTAAAPAPARPEDDPQSRASSRAVRDE